MNADKKSVFICVHLRPIPFVDSQLCWIIIPRVYFVEEYLTGFARPGG